jgi:hypothetical protein
LNLISEEILVIKMSQEDIHAREIVASMALKKLKWAKEPLCSYEILTFAHKHVGQYLECFENLM